MALTLRNTKGTPLTHDEMDANFSGLADGTLITAAEASVVSFTQSGTGATATTVQAELRRVVWVEQFGAVGDGTTDDSSAIQKAIDAIGSSGGEVRFGPKTYKIATGLSTNTANLALVGAGNVGQDDTVGTGATVIDVSGAIVGFTFNSAASSTNHRGPLIRDIHFRGTSSGTGAILLKRCNNWNLENVAISEFSTGYGIKSDGTGNVNQYGTITNPKIHHTLIAYDGILSNGIRFLGGFIQGTSGSVFASSTAIRQQSGDTLSVFGTCIQYYETGIDLQAGDTHYLSGPRLEGFTTGLKIASTGAFLSGGSFNNNIIGGTGTAISVTAAASRTQLFPGRIASVSTKISDSGSNTFYLLENLLHLDTGISLLIQASGSMRLINNLYVDGALVVDRTNGTNKLLFGSAQDTNLYRSASNVLKTDDRFLCATAYCQTTNVLTSTAGAITFNAGYNYLVLTEDVTAITVQASPQDGEEAIITFKQAAGLYTVAGWPASVLLAGGAFTMTATDGKYDTIRLKYNATAAKWLEVSRTQNC